MFILHPQLIKVITEDYLRDADKARQAAIAKKAVAPFSAMLLVRRTLSRLGSQVKLTLASPRPDEIACQVQQPQGAEQCVCLA